MFNDLAKGFSGLGRQVAFGLVFIFVVTACLLAIQAQASGDEEQQVTDTQALISLLVTGRANEALGAEEIIEAAALAQGKKSGQGAADQLVKVARNHYLTIEDIKGGFIVTGWTDRSSKGQYFRYQRRGGLVSQTCNGGMGCQNQGTWLFPANLCPSTEAECQATIPAATSSTR